VTARFDLLVDGGEVLDPGGNLLGRLDLGIRDGRIVAAAPSLPRSAAAEAVGAQTTSPWRTVFSHTARASTNCRR
jgi:N-acyl-D-aspartate/D-glutamate deacylase